MVSPDAANAINPSLASLIISSLVKERLQRLNQNANSSIFPYAESTYTFQLLFQLSPFPSHQILSPPYIRSLSPFIQLAAQQILTMNVSPDGGAEPKSYLLVGGMAGHSTVFLHSSNQIRRQSAGYLNHFDHS